MSTLPNDARIIDSAFQAILALDWPRLESLRRVYPHLLFDYAAPPVVSFGASYRGTPGIVTRNLEETAFVVEACGESAARWIGFGLAEEDELSMTWLGTRRLPNGRWAAQFLILESEDVIAA